jgi:hypothetical protein
MMLRSLIALVVLTGCPTTPVADSYMVMDGRFPSDHLPVIAGVLLTRE